MNAPAHPTPPPLPATKALSAEKAQSPEKTLRKLFLTLFLRGHSARGLRKEGAPTSVAGKLRGLLFFYGLMGCLALLFVRQSTFALSAYLHAMTFVFLGMFVSASAGEVLFNKEEADILLHRPVTPRVLLWAKIRVLVEVSLWIAGAFNLVGMLVGAFAPDGSWLFPFVHLVSTALEALFCTGCVVLAYQLCLRWFGRARLEGLMTTAQVLVSVGAVLAGQIAPRLMFRLQGVVLLSAKSWWVGLLPPAWFAGLDDAIAGGRALGSDVLAIVGLAATGGVLWAAFGKLAEDYEAGLQKLGETVSRPRRQGAGRRWLDVLVNAPPLRWWLRDPVERASFLLTAAYLVRDRDVKLRLYPGLAPMLVLPVVFLVQGGGRHDDGGMGLAIAGAYVGLVPMLALKLLQYSPQWQAADVFRVAPLAGPMPLCHGARRAVLLFLTLPVVAAFGLVGWLFQSDPRQLLLLLPGLILLPIYALVPSWSGGVAPLSLPTENAKSAGRGLIMIAVTLVSMALGAVAVVAWRFNLFKWFLPIETIAALGLYVSLRRAQANVPWPALE